MKTITKSWWKNRLANYVKVVGSQLSANSNKKGNELTQWKDRLFVQFLIYCFPVCLVAVIPCVYVSFESNYNLTGIIDLACFGIITFVTFSQRLSLQRKKYAIISMFYVLATFLTGSLGYIGPGVFYLLTITLFASLFLSIRYAYFSIFSNAFIISLFGAVIYFRPFNSVLDHQYTLSAWLAFSSNLIFVSLILVVLIEKIFHGLQATIENKEAAKAKYHTIFDHSPLPMWLFDIGSLRFLDVNAAAVAHYGYTKTEFLAMTLRDIRPAEDIPDLEDTVINNRTRYKFYDRAVRHKKKNGDQILVTIKSSQIDYKGRPAKLVLAADITQQVKDKEAAIQANEKVKQSEFNMRAIFESAVQGFVLLDIADTIIVSNPTAIRYIIAGNGVNEFRAGDSIFDYLEPSRLPLFKSYLDRVKTGERVEYDRKFVTDTRMMWVHYCLTPVYEQNEIIGTCISGQDITSLKLHLEKIENQNRVLKHISWMQSHIARAPLARIIGLSNLIVAEQDEKERETMIKLLELTTSEFDDTIKEITAKINAIDDDVSISNIFDLVINPLQND